MTVMDKNIEVTREKKFMLVFTYIGEGYNDVYDESDPDDCPLIRADLYTWNEEYDDWNDEEYDSYCTALDASMPIEDARKIAEQLADKLEAKESWGKEPLVMIDTLFSEI